MDGFGDLLSTSVEIEQLYFICLVAMDVFLPVLWQRELLPDAEVLLDDLLVADGLTLEGVLFELELARESDVYLVRVHLGRAGWLVIYY